jgi:hypothetical protein
MEATAKCGRPSTALAKERFEMDDLLERGRALVEESINFGVTHMRAFVEVDPTVRAMCLDVGLLLKGEFKDRCLIQLCVFAQDPIYSRSDHAEMQMLLTAAVRAEGVSCIGSAPYVERSSEDLRRNISFVIGLAAQHDLLMDFHLDYNIDPRTPSTIPDLLRALKDSKWNGTNQVTLGHCTRLTLLERQEWDNLRWDIWPKPISFVGLPTSDLFMMGRPSDDAGGGVRPRATLQIPQMIKEHHLEGAIGVNNVGNAFTPQGSCDPLALASMGVGIYQCSTTADTEILMVRLPPSDLAPLQLSYESGPAVSFMLTRQRESPYTDR